MESSKGDIVQCLNLIEGEVEELETVIANGEESVTKARAEDRDKRMAKLQPCRNATDIMAMLKDIPLPNSLEEVATFKQNIVPISGKLITKQQKVLGDLDNNKDMSTEMATARKDAASAAKTHLFVFAVWANLDMVNDSKAVKARDTLAKELEKLDAQKADVEANKFTLDKLDETLAKLKKEANIHHTFVESKYLQMS